jgi:hypothetical protein
MSGRRLPIDFNAAGRALDENGEIGIGAFARRQMRRRWMFGAFGVCLMAMAGGLYWGLGGDRDRSSHTPIVALRCGGCGHAESRALPLDQPFPMVCPGCVQPALRPLWICRDCKEQFLPALKIDPVRCPKCNSDQVGAVPSTPPHNPG